MPGNEDIKSLTFENWVNNSVDQIKRNYAEILAVNLLELVGNCHMDEIHGDRVVNLLTGLHKRVKIHSNKVGKIVLF